MASLKGQVDFLKVDLGVLVGFLKVVSLPKLIPKGPAPKDLGLRALGHKQGLPLSQAR